MKIKSLILSLLCLGTIGAFAQGNYPFNGLDMNMGNLSRLSNAKTRSISPENYTGEKGKGGMADPKDKEQRNAANAWAASKDLGKGWKVNPFIDIQGKEVITIAEIEGPGAIQQIWMTPQETGDFLLFASIGMMKKSHPLNALLAIFSVAHTMNMHNYLLLPFV